MNDLTEKEEDGVMNIFNVIHNNIEFLIYSGPHMLAIANADKRIISTTMLNDTSMEFDYLIPDYSSGIKESFDSHPTDVPYDRDNIHEFVKGILNKHAELTAQL